MKFTVGGRAIDLEREQVAHAMEGVEAETIREHLVEINGTVFPPKQVFATVTGWPRQSFTTMEAQRVLAKLDFVCRRAGKLADGNAAWVPVQGNARPSKERHSPLPVRPSTAQPATAPDAQVTVREALTEGREAVASALAIGATSGPEPDEDTLTWLLQSAAAWKSDRITVRRFTRHEESNYTRADWLWWWEGKADEWFGCLVQAKRIVRDPSGLTFAFDFRPTPSTTNPAPPPQIQRLLEASDALAVPAAYLLYRSPVLGQPQSWGCPSIAPDWNTAAATFVAAAIVNEWFVYDRPAQLETTRPIECLACDGLCGDDLARLAWYAANLADPAIRRILQARPTTAARRAFRALFSDVVELRASQFRGRAPDLADQMHSGFQLGEHFARGVRQPPWYVSSILQGEAPEHLPESEHVTGVVIISEA